MIRHKKIEKSNKIRVTFVVAHDPEQAQISVVGDFNDWDPTSHKLVKRNNGTRSVALTLEPGRRYAFRYYTADGHWFNDEAADAYEASEHDSDNCILLT